MVYSKGGEIFCVKIDGQLQRTFGGLKSTILGFLFLVWKLMATISQGVFHFKYFLNY